MPSVAFFRMNKTVHVIALVCSDPGPRTQQFFLRDRLLGRVNGLGGLVLGLVGYRAC